MPVDPNEPVYCLCKRVSFGQMVRARALAVCCALLCVGVPSLVGSRAPRVQVGCDNDDCDIEWFHYECVGLQGAPKGKWYCPTCRRKR